jgi:hypothetical protein
VIECRVTPWYFKRMAMMAVMLTAFGLYFLYDGKYGYPAANEKAAKKDWFEKEVLGSFETASKAGTIPQWVEDAKTKGWPTGKDGEPPKWLSYSSEMGLPEKPKRYTDKEIEEQFWWGGAMLILAVATVIAVLLNRGKVVRGYDDRFITTAEKEVLFSHVFRVDKRKWESKGLATVFYREKPDGPELKTKLDCLKYDEKGMEAILAALLGKFSGELIEKVEEPEEEEEAEESDKPRGK